MGFRMLVVDDSLTIRKLVELSFRSAGCTLEFAPSGKDALKQARANCPDIILLDVVLPDMKGVDVCEQLAHSPTLVDVPILLMSGKPESVREQFVAYKSVVGFIAKPFQAEEILGRVNAIIEQKKGAPKPKRVAESTAALFNFDEMETAAKALYGRLKPHLAHVPEWMAQMGNASPAQFFARKILSPEVMVELLDALAPTFFEALARQRAGMSPSAGDSQLSGRLTGWPLVELLRSLAATRGTGELSLTRGGQSARIYFRRGQMMLAASNDPQAYGRGATADLRHVAPALRARAEDEQVTSHKPFYVALAEAGQIPSADLGSLLYEQGKRLVLELFDAKELQFAWHESTGLPLYVDAHGRVISLAQLLLERSRGAGAHADGGAAKLSPNAVFERAAGFSRKLRDLDLNGKERRVLALCDGARTVAQVGRRSGLPAGEVPPLVWRLQEVGLLAERVAVSSQSRKVLIFEPDADGFRRSLQRHLSTRSVSYELVPLAREQDVLAAVLHERPALVIFNATESAAVATQLAKAMTSAELDSVALSAVLDYPASSRAEELVAAGFDAVLTKPLHLAELERLLPA